MVDWGKAFSLISSGNLCQKFSPTQITDSAQAGFEPLQNLSSDFFEENCAVVITTTPRHHCTVLNLSYCTNVSAKISIFFRLILRFRVLAWAVSNKNWQGAC